MLSLRRATAAIAALLFLAGAGCAAAAPGTDAAADTPRPGCPRGFHRGGGTVGTMPVSGGFPGSVPFTEFSLPPPI